MIDYRKIKRLREELEFTQADLAKLTDLTIQTISTIENGHHTNLRLRTVHGIAKALKVKPAELLK